MRAARISKLVVLAATAWSLGFAGAGPAWGSQAPMFGTAVTVRRAPTPYGPFSAPETIATAAPPPVPGAFTYNAILHPELAAGGLQLLSWNVNANGDLLADATLYRPRFQAVRWPPAGDRHAGR